MKIHTASALVLSVAILSSDLLIIGVLCGGKDGHGGEGMTYMMLAAMLGLLGQRGHHHHQGSHPIPIPIPIPVGGGGGGGHHHEVVVHHGHHGHHGHHDHHGHHEHHGHGSHNYYDVVRYGAQLYGHPVTSYYGR